MVAGLHSTAVATVPLESEMGSLVADKRNGMALAFQRLEPSSGTSSAFWPGTP